METIFNDIIWKKFLVGIKVKECFGLGYLGMGYLSPIDLRLVRDKVM
jgi:hypothetical protein